MILKVKPENCYVSEITLGELYFGASFRGCAAILNNMVMVTDNVKYLGRLPGIMIENWVNRVA